MLELEIRELAMQRYRRRNVWRKVQPFLACSLLFIGVTALCWIVGVFADQYGASAGYTVARTSDNDIAGPFMTFLGFAAVGLALYFLPTIIANVRSHRNTMAIVMVNIFLGWTFLGWVAALVWACTYNVRTHEERNVMY